VARLGAVVTYGCTLLWGWLRALARKVAPGTTGKAASAAKGRCSSSRYRRRIGLDKGRNLTEDTLHRFPGALDFDRKVVKVVVHFGGVLGKDGYALDDTVQRVQDAHRAFVLLMMAKSRILFVEVISWK
jgi:hypothetical protein